MTVKLTQNTHLYLQLRHLQENVHFFLRSCCKTKRTLEDFCAKTVFTPPRFLRWDVYNITFYSQTSSGELKQPNSLYH